MKHYITSTKYQSILKTIPSATVHSTFNSLHEQICMKYRVLFLNICGNICTCAVELCTFFSFPQAGGKNHNFRTSREISPPTSPPSTTNIRLREPSLVRVKKCTCYYFLYA